MVVMLIMLFDKSAVTLEKGRAEETRGHRKVLEGVLSLTCDESPGCVYGALHVLDIDTHGPVLSRESLIG